MSNTAAEQKASLTEAEFEKLIEPLSLLSNPEHRVFIHRTMLGNFRKHLAEQPSGLPAVTDEIKVKTGYFGKGAHERHTELADYEFEWHSFYHGWLEGRVKMYQDGFRLSRGRSKRKR